MRRLVLSLTILLVAATPATADFRVNGQIAYEWAGHVWLTNQDGSNQRDIALRGRVGHLSRGVGHQFHSARQG